MVFVDAAARRNRSFFFIYMAYPGHRPWTEAFSFFFLLYTFGLGSLGSLVEEAGLLFAHDTCLDTMIRLATWKASLSEHNKSFVVLKWTSMGGI